MNIKHAKGDAPEMLALKLHLSLDTRVDAYAFADWIRANKNWLNQALVCDGVTAAGQPDHYGEVYAWARMEFKRYLAARTAQSQLSAVASPPTVAPSATQPQSARFLRFSNLFRRRAV